MKKPTLLSPLRVFGNRDEDHNDFFKLISLHLQERQKPYRCCYDLFSGSASLSLMAMKNAVAESYVVNDVFPPFAIFWTTLQHQPDALIRAYQENYDAFIEAKDKEAYYRDLQEYLNTTAVYGELSKNKYASIFALIINLAQNGVLLFRQQDEKQYCECVLGADGNAHCGPTEFAEAVLAAHKLISENKVHFTSNDFTKYSHEFSKDDLVFMNPPSDFDHLSQTRDKRAMQLELSKVMQTLSESQTSFILFYGVLGFYNPYPIAWPKGHLFNLIGSQTEPLNQYIEHMYVSENLARVFVANPSLQGNIQPLFHRMFEIQANHNAHRIALVADGQSLVYADLNAATNRLARRLQTLSHDASEPLFAVYLERSPQLIITLLAIMKSGAAFMLLETNSDALTSMAAHERIKKSGAKWLITHPPLAASLQKIAEDTSWQTLEISRDDYRCEQLAHEFSSENLDSQISPQQLAYVMYTSGSTGEPKGVEILHRGLPYAFGSHQDLLNLGPTDRIAQFASVGFDASLMEIMMALACGGALYVAPKECYRDYDKLRHFYQTQQITIIIQTPKILGILNSNDYRELRAVLIVGESFGKSLADNWQPRQVINGYGLTETTIVSTLEQCDLRSPLTMGEPILGLIAKLQPITDDVSDAQTGELYFSGPCVARGYWQRKEIAAERFQADSQGVVWYKTGDIVQQLASGKLVYLYRLDRQIKLRGQRVELDEIQNRIQELEEILAVRVLVQITASHQKRIVAYIVPRNPDLIMRAGEVLTAKQLLLLKAIKSYLKSKLPGFMCPAITNMVFVDQLLLKDNDKKSCDDRKMLATWTLPFCKLPSEKLNKFSRTQKGYFSVMRDIALEVLSLPEAEAQDFTEEHDFYDWSGDSITVNVFLSRVKKYPYNTLPRRDSAFERGLQQISIIDFNEEPTLLGIWQWCQRQSAATAKAEKEFKDNIPLLLSRSLSQGLLAKSTGVESGQFKVHSKTICFCVHSIMGDAELDYQQSVLQHLPCQMKMLSIPTQRLRYTKSPEEYWQKLIHIHIKMIKRTQARGPYWLLGWSTGGLVANKIAEELRASGERVFVIILDSAHPVLFAITNPIAQSELLLLLAGKIRDAIAFLLQMELTAANFPVVSLEVLREELEINQQINRIFDQLQYNLSQLPQNNREIERARAIIINARQLFNVELVCQNFSEKNKLSTILDRDTLLIVCEDSARKWESPVLGWDTEKLQEQNVCTLKNCDHFALINTDNLVSEFLEPYFATTLESVKKPFYRGLECLLHQKFAEAIEFFSIVIQHNPKHAVAYNNRARAKAYLRDHEAAVADFTWAIAFNNEYAEAYNNRALSYFLLSRYEDAIKDATKALELKSGLFPLALRNRARAYAALGEVDLAIADCDEALRQQSPYEKVERLRAELELLKQAAVKNI